MRETDDSIEAEIIETVANELGRPFGRVTVSPLLVQQPVPHLHLAGVRNVLEREPADEGTVVASRCAPRTEAVPISISARDALQRRIDFRTRRRLPVADVAHDARVGVEAKELVGVVNGEFTKVEPKRLHPG